MAATGTGTASKAAVWIIILLLIVGLGGFGVTNFSGNVRSIGTVGDTDIDVGRYARDLQQQISALSAQTGQQLTLSDAQQFGVDQAVLQQLVGTVALENEAAILGISVGDEEIRRQVLAIPAFQGLDGGFDRLAYADALDRSGLNEEQFENSLRAEVARTLVQGAVVSGITAPDAFVDRIFNFALERRSFSWASLGVDDLFDPITDPGDADIRAYYDENSDDFMLPETKVITYAWLTPDMIVDGIESDEDILRALYEERIGQYVTAERRLVERLIFPGQAEAEAAKAELDAGTATFEDLAAARELDLADLDLGDVTADDLGPAGEAVFALTEPGIAGPADTDLGPALFRVNAILAAQETRFEDARGELLDEYRLDSARRAIGDQIDPIDDLLAGGATLEELADETDMQVGRIDWTVNESGGIAAYSAFRTAAAAAVEGDFPEVVALDDGGIFALRLDEVIAERLQPYEDARGRAESGWRAVRTVAALADQARAQLPQLEGGAETSDLTLQEETGVTRTGFVPGTPPDFLTAVFDMELGEARVVEGGNAAYLVRLDAIAPPDTADTDVTAQRDGYATSIAQSIGADILRAYSDAIQAQAGISLNQAAINAVHSQFP
ncbi:MAG: SurA N-terminal domain-containing protein [Rhodobacter sp.]|nr:SurA N-terminal domain-containing protein [Rhodobacter sp.]